MWTHALFLETQRTNLAVWVGVRIRWKKTHDWNIRRATGNRQGEIVDWYKFHASTNLGMDGNYNINKKNAWFLRFRRFLCFFFLQTFSFFCLFHFCAFPSTLWNTDSQYTVTPAVVRQEDPSLLSHSMHQPHTIMQAEDRTPCDTRLIPPKFYHLLTATTLCRRQDIPC